MRQKKITLQLFHDGVLVTKVEPEMTESGLFIPESARGDDNVFEGEVLAVGPGRYISSGLLVTPGFEVGDRILYGSGRGLDVTIEGQKVRCLTCSDVLGVFPRKKERVN